MNAATLLFSNDVNCCLAVFIWISVAVPRYDVNSVRLKSLWRRACDSFWDEEFWRDAETLFDGPSDGFY